MVFIKVYHRLTIAKLQAKIDSQSETTAVDHALDETELELQGKLVELERQLKDSELAKSLLVDLVSEKTCRIVQLETIVQDQQTAMTLREPSGKFLVDVELDIDHGSDLGVPLNALTMQPFKPSAVRTSSLKGILPSRIDPIDLTLGKTDRDKYYQNIVFALQSDNIALRKELDRRDASAH